MKTLVYLDQNILSDMRQRKLAQNKDKLLQLIKDLLIHTNLQLVFSHVHLEEISQISKEEYRLEHIDLLDELGAKYIDPKTYALANEVPSILWEMHCKNQQVNEYYGISDVMSISELTARKLTGLTVEEAWDELAQLQENSLVTMFKSAADNLGDPSNEEDLPTELEEALGELKQSLIGIAEGGFGIDSLPVEEDVKVGPLPFRQAIGITRQALEELPHDEVIPAIKKIMGLDRSVFDMTEHFEDTPEFRVSTGYFLLNWAGYHADDFTKEGGKKDRFRASSNDMQHAVSATRTTVLITNDKGLLRKAPVCYAYANVGTMVLNPMQFINICKTSLE